MTWQSDVNAGLLRVKVARKFSCSPSQAILMYTLSNVFLSPFCCFLIITITHVLLSFLAVPPQIVTAPETIEVEEDEDVVITCEILGIPQPRATWYHGEKTIKANKKYKIETTSTTATLKIAKPKIEDSATFTLKLDNPVGEDQRSIPVTIKRK